MRKVFILDAGAFLSGFIPGNREEFYTVSGVFEELRDRNARLRAEAALQESSLKIINPPGAEELHKTIHDTGDADKLSSTDLKILSLALFLRGKGLRPVIVSDDYAIQNVAYKLKIEYMPTTERGIKRFIRWHRVCTGCGKEFPVTYPGECDVCGSGLKKRAVK